MATAIQGSRPQQEVNWNLLQDPRISARLKALLVSLETFCELHLLTLRAHDLVSIAHVHRVDRIPDQLYELLENLRGFERRFANMLFRIHQYPEMIYVVFFAKTFSDRPFECGDLNRQLEQTVSRSIQTRQDFRRQIQDAERELRNFEQDIYARGIFQVTSSTNRRSRAQKVFLPQPHALEYLPVTIELYNDRVSRSEMFIVPQIFLRNRRQQLEVAMEQIHENRYRGQFDPLDVRDFRHEFELLESEMILVSDLQRLLNNVKMIEEAGTRSMSSTPSGTQVFSALFQETADALESLARSGNNHSFLDRNVPHARPTESEPPIILSQNFNSMHNIISPMGSAPAFRNLASSHGREIRPGSANLASEQRTPSWMINTDYSTNVGGRRVNPRGRWFLQGLNPEVIGSEAEVRQRLGSDSSQSNSMLTQGLGSNNNENSRNNVISGSGRSAFHRIQPQPLGFRPRPSAISTEFLEMGANNGNTIPTVMGFDNQETNCHGSSEIQTQLLRNVMGKIEDVLQVALRNEQSIADQRSELMLSFEVLDQVRRQVIRMREDLATMKRRMFDSTSAEPFSISHPVRNNASDDLWRNLDTGSSRTSNDRPHMNISSRHWDSSTRIDNQTVTNDVSRITRTGFNLPPTPDSRDDAIASTATPSRNTDHFETQRSPSGMLNNQVPPGNRANNYWDNFKSYSRLNLLSDSNKTNLPVFSPPSGGVGLDDHLTDEVFSSSSAALRRDSRDRTSGVSTMRSSLSANFVENIGQKKRNKDQKMQFQTNTSGSPANSTSSNSSAAPSLGEYLGARPIIDESIDNLHLGEVRDREEELPSLSQSDFPSAINFVSSAVGLNRSLEEAAELCPTTTQIPSLSPPSSLEVDLVSRDEFLQLNSGAGSSASGNGRSDDGGPSSSSSKKELEKLLATDNEDRPQSSNDWSIDFQNGAVENSKPAREPDWLWSVGNSHTSEAEHDEETETSVQKRNESTRSRNEENDN